MDRDGVHYIIHNMNMLITNGTHSVVSSMCIIFMLECYGQCLSNLITADTFFTLGTLRVLVLAKSVHIAAS